MINRASAERPSAFTSFRLRATIERRLVSSTGVAGSAVTVWLASSFAQVMLTFYHEQPGFGQYLAQK